VDAQRNIVLYSFPIMQTSSLFGSGLPRNFPLLTERPEMAQSDLLAKAPHGHPDVGGIYHVIVRFSLEPDRHFLGQTGLWRSYKKAGNSAR
jgi:hypothetical protein